MHSVLTELLRLYDWRREVGATITNDQAREYGHEKKAAWEAARRVLASSETTPKAPGIRCVWVIEREYGYGKALRVVDSDHPHFPPGSRFDFGFLNVAVMEGYRVEIEPVPPFVKHDIEAEHAKRR